MITTGLGEKQYCDLCENMAIEDAEHVIMHYPNLQKIREAMHREIESLEQAIATNCAILSNSTDMFTTLLGGLPEDTQSEVAIPFLRIVAIHVYKMYRLVTVKRDGIG